MEACHLNNFYFSYYGISNWIMDKQITKYRCNNNNLGAAPGGISGMSLLGSEYGVGAAVATLHAVRLITVLLILPLVVKCLNLLGVIKS